MFRRGSVQLFRKVVYIPVVPVKGRTAGTVLEIILEGVGLCSGRQPQLHHLRATGLHQAALEALAVLRLADLRRPSPHELYQRLPKWGGGAPRLFVSNPAPCVEDASAAELGIALGMLMYRGYIPEARLLATGALAAVASERCGVQIDARCLHAQLETVLAWRRHPTRMFYFVPARLRGGTCVREAYHEQIHTLANRNIKVVPVATLADVLTLG